ncbi:MAG: MEDS domain-containing protein [Candidatus Eremiobacteraeota bacterium]|nr:MEDS domain-containing protein [Candidatus Eremiobacteraeota bacterium]
MRKNEHLVHFYGQDEQRLDQNLTAFLRDSLRAGGAAVVVASPARRDAFQSELARNPIKGLTLPSERLVLLDDAETLGTFMRGGQPDAELFDSCVGNLLRDRKARYGRVRAYGEMVGRLWSDRAFSAAVALEKLWNELLASLGFDLYCGYPIDVTSAEFQTPAMRALFETHTRLVPALPDDFDRAMSRAIDEVLGDRPHGLHALATGALSFSGAALPSIERTILRLRSALPRYADEILARAKQYA